MPALRAEPPPGHPQQMEQQDQPGRPDASKNHDQSAYGSPRRAQGPAARPAAASPKTLELLDSVAKELHNGHGHPPRIAGTAMHPAARGGHHHNGVGGSHPPPASAATSAPAHRPSSTPSDGVDPDGKDAKAEALELLLRRMYPDPPAGQQQPALMPAPPYGHMPPANGRMPGALPGQLAAPFRPPMPGMQPPGMPGRSYPQGPGAQVLMSSQVGPPRMGRMPPGQLPGPPRAPLPGPPRPHPPYPRPGMHGPPPAHVLVSPQGHMHAAPPPPGQLPWRPPLANGSLALQQPSGSGFSPSQHMQQQQHGKMHAHAAQPHAYGMLNQQQQPLVEGAVGAPVVLRRDPLSPTPSPGPPYIAGAPANGAANGAVQRSLSEEVEDSPAGAPAAGRNKRLTWESASPDPVQPENNGGSSKDLNDAHTRPQGGRSQRQRI